MDFTKFSNLIEKYGRGELSPREKEKLEIFLGTFQTNHTEWVEIEMGKKIEVEEKIFSRILRTIKEENNHHLSKTSFSPSLLKRAAAIAFFFILSTGILYLTGIFPDRTRPAVWHEAVTLAGDKSVLVLSDGSQVTLNADTKLKYPDRFNGTNREVYLEGEGYFVVQHISGQPFVVHAGNVSTTVLGTKFDVSAYPESKTIAVSLLEGKVRVTSNEKGNIDKTVVLEPKEQLLYDKENDVGSFGLFDSLESVGWKDNIYKFVDEPLGKVFSQLERAYGIKFKITDQPVLAQRITVKFEKHSLQTVIDVLKSLTGLNYRLVRGEDKVQEIVFFGKTK